MTSPAPFTKQRQFSKTNGANWWFKIHFALTNINYEKFIHLRAQWTAFICRTINHQRLLFNKSNRLFSAQQWILRSFGENNEVKWQTVGRWSHKPPLNLQNESKIVRSQLESITLGITRQTINQKPLKRSVIWFVTSCAIVLNLCTGISSWICPRAPFRVIIVSLKM